jgi:hypothetical protein
MAVQPIRLSGDPVLRAGSDRLSPHPALGRAL